MKTPIGFNRLRQKVGRTPLIFVFGLLCLIAPLGYSQTVLFEENFNGGLGAFSGQGRVTTGSYGVRLRGGTTTQITSAAINVAGASNLSLSFSRTTSGLDAGEVGSASYSFDGSNYITLESERSVNGSVRFNLPAGGSRLFLRFQIQASSYFETYTLSNIVIEGEGDDPTPPPPPPPPPPSACGDNNLRTGESTRTLTINGMRREYIVYVPRSYNGSNKVPLLLDFHPLSQDADFQFDNSGMRELSEQENFIVAFPDGIDNAWNFGPCCTRSRQVDDLGFARAIINDISRNACVDDKRVYAAGYSNGGGMAYHLACNASDVVAAVAPAAFDLVEEVSCRPSRPISVYMSRGRFDFIVPYRGGSSTPPTGYPLDPITFLGAEGTFEEWGDINSCPSNTTTLNGCDAYRNCAGGTEVVLCTEFGGHSGWDASDAWDYLQDQRLP